jgi:hypothetical protein
MNEEQDKWVRGQMNGKEVVKSETKPREEIVYKYSNKGQQHLRESILVDEKPYFMAYAFNEDKSKDFFVTPPIIEDNINNRVLRPPNRDECPYEPYDFTASSINGYYLPKVKQATINTLYQQVKSYVKSFNDVHEMASRLLSFNIIGSYFQDRFSTTHYMMIIGDNGAGKSAFGDTFECLGYRPVKASNTNESFWYRVLGTVEIGQVTVIAEEIDRLDENSKIMEALKEGYQQNSKIPRMNNDNSKMDFYRPYCFKMLIGEKSPDPSKAKGVLDRTFQYKAYKGFPQFKIKDIRNHQDNKARQSVLNRLKELRRVLLMYRLIHYKVPYVEVKVGVDGRDEELCKPLLQLFYTLGASKETMTELEECLQYFLDKKNEDKKDSLEAQVLESITEYTKENNKYEISSRGVWELVCKNLDGKLDDNNPDVFYSTDYGRLYINKVTKIVKDKFGAKTSHDRKTNTMLIFNEKILTRVIKNYRIGTKIKTVRCDALDACDASREDIGV